MREFVSLVACSQVFANRTTSLIMFGFRPEPIAIPTPQTSSSLELPLPSANGVEAIVGVPAADVAAANASSAAASSLEPLEQLCGGLVGSEIQHADLQVLHNIGHGSSGVVQKVLHVVSGRARTAPVARTACRPTADRSRPRFRPIRSPQTRCSP